MWRAILVLTVAILAGCVEGDGLPSSPGSEGGSGGYGGAQAAAAGASAGGTSASGGTAGLDAPICDDWPPCADQKGVTQESRCSSDCSGPARNCEPSCSPACTGGGRLCGACFDSAGTPQYGCTRTLGPDGIDITVFCAAHTFLAKPAPTDPTHGDIGIQGCGCVKKDPSTGMFVDCTPGT